MFTCTYDYQIACDAKYMGEEFERQMQAAVRSGDFFLNLDGSSKCPANQHRCGRYLAAQAAKCQNGR